MTENAGVFDQTAYLTRFDWGPEAVRRLAPLSDVLVIVDVLSFTTCVDIGVGRGAAIFPFRFKDESAVAFAADRAARLAGPRGSGSISLSPASLQSLEAGERVVLPSPNGSTCTVVAAQAGVEVLAACLRNARAVATYIRTKYSDAKVTVIACGEHWPNGDLRPAVEDLLGAGAVLSYFDTDTLSPEAKAATGAWKSMASSHQAAIASSASGRELIARGYSADVTLALLLNVSSAVPVLRDGAYTQAT